MRAGAARGLGLAAVATLLLGGATGLDRPLPPAPGEAPTPERVALGRLLFFDPVLSADGSLSCAHCHRPDRALADGLPTARGRDGARLARNTPTLYNAALKRRLMWDRRADSLEAQALLPLLAPDELGAEPARLLARLRAVPEYARRFAEAFPEDEEPLRLGNLARAIAAFERTLVSAASRYDRYARGDRDALTPSERNGLTLFRSLQTRCFECHRLPTFEAPLAVGIGVPSPDPGVGGVLGEEALRGAFAVPTLRNVARTAPYMHDGSLATLEEVDDFYREGGGRAHGVPAARVHEHVRPFAISDAEAADLVAFLRALSDESVRPEVPERVPSGLPVLEDLP
ncbi:MAG: cytochrome c peroxidase [Myxococcota bacterium]|nr:cytochrome c peroxidase [Myxococcota bacterium]